MGMDVYGKSPRSEVGEYFRRAVWGWHPLAEFCQQFEISNGCNYWHSNDGDGLDDEDASRLAADIRQAIANGEATAYIGQRNRELAEMPDEDCRICGGTGARLPVPEVGPGDQPCNGCNSTGKVRPWGCNYHLDVDDLNEFAAFLEDCGGFAIN